MRRKSISILIVLAAVLTIGYCAWQIITTLQERYLSKQEYERTRESYVSAIDEPEISGPEIKDEETEDEEDDPFPDMTVDVDGLLQQNPDFTAWIYYKDAKINYPIVQETITAVDRYLKTTFEGNQNPSGCTFIPYDADANFRFLNTFVYGHNMANGSMFGTLKSIYHDPSKYLDPYFYIWTKEHQVIRYRVIAAYVVDSGSPMYSIPLTSKGYQEYINNAFSLGSFDQYVVFTEEEKAKIKSGSPIVSLSTCYGPAGTSKRLLVQGVEIERRNVD